MIKRKTIVVSMIGLLSLTGMVIGAGTLANNGNISSYDMRMGAKQKMMTQFANVEEAQAFRTAVEKAITDKNYIAFLAVHTQYGITKEITEVEFNEMLTQRANQERIQTVLKAEDYSTWKKLNEGLPILDIIDTESKFKRLQEIHIHNEKITTIKKELGIEASKGKKMGMHMGKERGKNMGKENKKEKGIGIGVGKGMNGGKRINN